uniref:Fibulin C-terminal Ig-like domain-containing protein n=2 Tax=Anguilla anguilla TaxID=7936 RepID=A0A0E9WZF7_ANGAN
MGPSNSVPGDQVQLTIANGNEDGYFSTQKMSTGGVIAVQRPIMRPRDFLLTVEMKLLRYGTPSIYVARIRVFVTQDLSSHQNSLSQV